jgi:MinD-like ATPase involved in chromosome partitioning or flagellar assembly
MPKIVSVHSLRHGTGQSSLIASLAVAIAQQGQQVGIMNRDLQSEGIHALFGLDNGQEDAILNDYLWNGFVHPTPSSLQPNFKVEPGAITLMGGDVYLAPCQAHLRDVPQLLQSGYDLGELSQCFWELNRRLNFDYLFIDNHAGLTEEALLSLILCDVLLLVVYLDQQCLQNVALTIDLARKLGISTILLIVNQVLPEWSEPEVKQQLEVAYGEPVIGILPFTQEMFELNYDGIFCLRYPKHSLTQKIQAIAQQILNLDFIEEQLYSSLPQR